MIFQIFFFFLKYCNLTLCCSSYSYHTIWTQISIKCLGNTNAPFHLFSIMCSIRYLCVFFIFVRQTDSVTWIICWYQLILALGGGYFIIHHNHIIITSITHNRDEETNRCCVIISAQSADLRSDQAFEMSVA